MLTKIKKLWSWLLLLVGIIIIAIFSWLFFSTRPVANYHSLPVPSLRRQNQAVIVRDPKLIETWMTFDYLNKIFDLPTNYLQTALAITDPHYPFLTIRHYVRLQKLEATSTLVLIKEIVTKYSPQK